KNLKCIHIAGTNGKGSTAHMLASILQEAGYNTGLYTSPHIKDFGERIRINGEMIDHDFVIRFVEKIKPAIEEISPSFFELTVAMGLDYFAEKQVTVAVIETGLGGRLDSTNIVNPVLSIITNIGLDHTDLLGKTLGEIASEKAGIIKKGVPVVIGEVNDETLPVFIEMTSNTQSELVLSTEQYLTEYISPEGGFLLVNLKDVPSGVVEKLRLDLRGLYQAKNAATVLSAVKVLRKQGWNIPENSLHEGLAKVSLNTGLHGRWEIIRQNPKIIVDVAHNRDGFAALLNQLELQFPNNKWHFILGFVNDKDINAIMELLPRHAFYYFTQAQIPRALPVNELGSLARKAGLKGNDYKNVNDAMSAVLSVAHENDAIICCGSFFVIAELNQQY
ncbi:MAG: bifunctional folylpolyglutamate synthase/dihydrofolate synthase, partial [Chitinophagaceae bacterium]